MRKSIFNCSKNFLKNSSKNSAASKLQQQAAYNQSVGHQIQKLRQVIPAFPQPKETIAACEDMSDKPGDVLDVNWTLVNSMTITPLYQAYKNCDLKTLVTHAYGKLDSNKALVVSSSNEPVDHFVTNKALLGWAPEVSEFSPKLYRRAHREVTYHLSINPSIFMQDADGGAHRSQAVRVRTVTDNAVAGLFLKNLSLPIRNVKATEFTPQATVIHAAGYQFAPQRIVEEFGGPNKSDLGLQKDQFVVTNENTNTIVIGGVQNLSLIKDSIAFLASKAAFQAGNLIVPSDSIVTKNGDVALVLGNTAQDVANVAGSDNSFELYGAHHNLLTRDGLSRFWGGFSFEKKLKTQAGDLVEELEGGAVRVTRAQTGVIPNVVKAPNTLVLLYKDANYVVPSFAKVNSFADAAKLIVSGFQGIEKEQPVFKSGFASATYPSVAFAQEIEERLKTLLAENTQVYIVNSASEKNVQVALSLIASGEAGKLSGTAAGKWSILKHQNMQSNAWKDEAKHTEKLNELFAAIEKQLASLPVPPQPAAPQQPAAKQ